MGVSIDTTTLLFGCAANEEETLRPRAVAALDALLGAYCRIDGPDIVHDRAFHGSGHLMGNRIRVVKGLQCPMPNYRWLLVDDFGARISDGLARDLLPLLWRASSQPKAYPVWLHRDGRVTCSRLWICPFVHVTFSTFSLETQMLRRHPFCTRGSRACQTDL